MVASELGFSFSCYCVFYYLSPFSIPLELIDYAVFILRTFIVYVLLLTFFSSACLHLRGVSYRTSTLGELHGLHIPATLPFEEISSPPVQRSRCFTL